MMTVSRAACVLLVAVTGCLGPAGGTGDSAAARRPDVVAATSDTVTSVHSGDGAPSHLKMYAMDSAMPLGQAVFSELAADTTALLPEAMATGNRLIREKLLAKLERDGFKAGGKRLADALRAFNGTARSSVAGDDQAPVIGTPGAYEYGPTLYLSFPDTLISEQDFSNTKYHWIASVINGSSDKGYAPLNIEAGESICVFAGATNGSNPDAYAYPVDADIPCSALGELVQSDFQPARKLKVLRTRHTDVASGSSQADIPAAARFELGYAPGNGSGREFRQMIGVKCGIRWCHVAQLGTTRQDLEPDLSDSDNSDMEIKKNGKFRGRYDYQMLADWRDETLVPSGVLASLRRVRRQT